MFAKNGLKLSDMKGLDYDDPQWEKLLQQLSVKDMKFLVGNGGWATQAIKSVGKVYCAESDGPAGVHNLMTQVNGNQFTSATNFGSTWNRELSYRIGEAFGDEARAYHIAGLYAPDMTPVLFYILRAVDLVLAALFVLYFVRRHKKMKAYKAAVKGE